MIHELLFGCLRLPPESGRSHFLEDYIQEIPAKMPIFDYDINAAKWYAQERARLSKIDKIPAFIDGQIASIAFGNDLILVTNNVADFQDFDGLVIENWLV